MVKLKNFSNEKSEISCRVLTYFFVSKNIRAKFGFLYHLRIPKKKPIQKHFSTVDINFYFFKKFQGKKIKNFPFFVKILIFENS